MLYIKLLRFLSIALFCSIMIISCKPIRQLHIPFSIAKEELSSKNDNVIRIYFDYLGSIYPNITIKDKEFREQANALSCYYYSNPKKINTISNQLDIPTINKDIYKCNEYKPYNDPIQKALIQNFADLINIKSKGKELIFIIHGFNTHPLDMRSSGAYQDMKKTREIINRPNREIQFVEIYWDGFSDQYGSCLMESFHAMKFWDNSQMSAVQSGLELRRLLSKIQKNRIKVFTHSHGAGVITNALFNNEKFIQSEYNNDPVLYDIKHNKYQSSKYKTPTSDFTIAMLAPAVPGENLFKYYYMRTTSSGNENVPLNNYKFIVGFNSNDAVTTKKKILTKKFGSTSLACKEDELESTKKILNKDEVLMLSVDFSLLKNGKKQKKHSWIEYLKNDNAIDSFLNIFNSN
ncbi:MAG: hypothetical protein ACPGSD_15290 [Flavobacteriales bacterium]